MSSLYKNLTASGSVSDRPGTLDRVIVNAAYSDGTAKLKLYDGTSLNTQPIGGTMTFSGSATFVDMEIAFGTALYAEVAGTCDLTIAYNGGDNRLSPKVRWER